MQRNQIHNHWLLDKKSQQWLIDLHGCDQIMVQFILQYIFWCERSYLETLNEIIILCGKSTHSVGQQGTLHQFVRNELLSWPIPIKCSMHSSDKALLVLDQDDVRRTISSIDQYQ